MGLPTRLVTFEVQLEHRGGVVQDLVVSLICERTDLPAAHPRLRVLVPHGEARALLVRSIDAVSEAITAWGEEHDVRFRDDPLRIVSIALRRGGATAGRFVGRAG